MRPRTKPPVYRYSVNGSLFYTSIGWQSATRISMLRVRLLSTRWTVCKLQNTPLWDTRLIYTAKLHGSSTQLHHCARTVKVTLANEGSTDVPALENFLQKRNKSSLKRKNKENVLFRKWASLRIRGAFSRFPTDSSNDEPTAMTDDDRQLSHVLSGHGEIN